MPVSALAYGLLGIQTERPPFSDLRVRQALSPAVDRAQLIQGVYSGRATAGGPPPPTGAGGGAVDRRGAERTAGRRRVHRRDRTGGLRHVPGTLAREPVRHLRLVERRG